MMYVGKCLIVGKVSLQLAVGIFSLGTLSPALLALAFHLGIVRLEHTAGGLIELVTEVSRSCQARQKLIVGLEVAKEAMTLVVVIALGKQFYRVFCIGSANLGERTVWIIYRHSWVQVEGALKNASVSGMPCIEIGIDSLLKTQFALHQLLEGRKAACETGKIVALHNTLIVLIGKRGMIARVLTCIAEENVVRMRNRRTGQFFLPVGISTIIQGIKDIVLAYKATPLIGR